MMQHVHRINVYCDTFIKGINFYTGWPVELYSEPDKLLEYLAAMETPDFVKKMAVDVQPLNDRESEATIDLYVTFQIRKERYTHKRCIDTEEERELVGFIHQLAAYISQKIFATA